MTVIRVGGVEEPFNLPWLLASEENALAPLGVQLAFENFAGGTGALVGALEDGSIDLATVLTEGGVTAVARGRGIKLHSAFTMTPLRWGIHVSAKADPNTVAELEGTRFAISRFGSGSELMAYVLADEQKWTLTDAHFVEVGGVDGAVDALTDGDAEVFLWERFVTAPLVKKGVFKFVDELPTPWPAFYTAASPELLTDDRALIDRVVTTVLGYGARLKADRAGTIDMIVDRYGMARDDAHVWLDGVEWPASPVVDDTVLTSVIVRMAELGRIDEVVPATTMY